VNITPNQNTVIKSDKIYKEHKFLPLQLSTSFQTFFTILISAIFSVSDVRVEVSQKISTNVVKNSAKVFICGLVICNKDISILPKFIGTSKQSYIKRSFNSINVSLGFLMFFSFVAAISYSSIPAKKTIQPGEDINIPQGAECVICISHKKNLIFWPCAHMCVCEYCFEESKSCPICKQKIEYYYKINYIA
jgi:Zinc finger, C3HC4 type (RING finger)